jgi:hypothetical protein
MVNPVFIKLIHYCYLQRAIKVEISKVAVFILISFDICKTKISLLLYECVQRKLNFCFSVELFVELNFVTGKISNTIYRIAQRMLNERFMMYMAE